MKKLRHIVSLMLVFCMVFSLAVTSFAAFGESRARNPYEHSVTEEEGISVEEASEEIEIGVEPEEEPVYDRDVEKDKVISDDDFVTIAEPQADPNDEKNSTFYKIVHLDCGRKYFSPENIKKIIDEAAGAGFNQVELYLSDNQGFRFALDDMNVTTSTSNTYDLTPALGDGYSDGSKYPDGSGKYLTQSEMDDIINHAKGKGVDIVPCINVPGHMGAILEEFTQFKYSGSKSSIDLENEEAVAFALAITEKYAAYFAGQGVKFYNLGADEYANDMSTMGFEGLYNSGKYQNFVNFLNSAAQIVINHGMIPRAFNDGICYNNNTSYNINNSIQVCYWSSGWSGYNVASAATLANAGYSLINTHGDYYWVLGNSGWQCSADKAKGFNYTAFQGDTISDPAGAMFCIWCDVGNANGTDDGAAVVNDTASVIAAFGATAPTVTVVPLTSGTIAGIDSNMKIGETQTLSVGESATWTSSNVNVVSLSSNPKTRSVNDTSVTATADGAGTATITATTDTHVYSATITVTSTGVEVAKNETINVTVGEAATAKIEGEDYSDNVDITELDESIATVSVKYSQIDGGKTFNAVTSITNNSAYYVKDNNGNYLTADAKWSSNIEDASAWTFSSYNSGYRLTNNSKYLMYYNNSWTTSTKRNNATTIYNDNGILYGNREYVLFYGYRYYDEIGTIGTINTVVPTSGTVVTFTGVSAGTTYVTVGNTRYTINVLAENLSNVTPLTVEYWITNVQVTDSDGLKSKEIKADAVNYEIGVELKTLVPQTGTANGQSNVFWKGTRLAYDNRQTTGGGVDKTTSGTDFTRIRYWEGSWAYSADGETWISVISGDQIVAYYLQKTTVTDEVTTYVVDWGPNYDDYTDLGNYVLLDFAVVYESGERVPTSFPNNKAGKKTIGFHCDTSPTNLGKVTFEDNEGYYYRHIGMIKGEETANYEIYMITLTPTNDNKGTKLSGSSASANSSYEYEGTEKVVWINDEANLGNFADASLHHEDYSVGGEPIVPGLDIYNKQGMLVTYYVRAKVTEDSLTVHYIDQTANQEFYNYNIAVASGTIFNANIGLANPWKGVLANGNVTNLQGNTQTVSADLSTMPTIGAQYRYSDYTCVIVIRSDDGKDVYLYYTFNNAHSFVVDFGLPIVITANDMHITGDWTSSTVSVTNATGTVETNSAEKTLTYTPTSVLDGPHIINLTLIGEGSTGSATHRIYIYPASNVMYEETFMTKSSVGNDWTHKDATEVPYQSVEELGYEKNVHGFDNKYDVEEIKFSNDSYYKANLVISEGATQVLTDEALTFTFTGTGFDLISECGTNTGMLLVRVSTVDEEGKATLVRGYIVDTYFRGDEEIITGNGVRSYQVPVVREMNKPYGKYKVEVYGLLASTSGAVKTFAVNALNTSDSEDLASSILTELGLSAEEASMFEVVYMDENSVLNGGTGVSSSDVVRDRAMRRDSSSIMLYDISDEYELNATDNTDPVSVYVDGFRVYQPMQQQEPAYAYCEKGTTYYNVYDFIKNSAGELDNKDDNLAVYVEYDGATNVWNIADYKKNGPENEVYLTNGSAIAFILDGYKPQENMTVHIAAKAIYGEPVISAVEDGGIAYTATEMYYKVNPESIVSLNMGSEIYYYVLIKNTDPDTSVVSISGLKVSSNIKPIESAEIGELIVQNLNEEASGKFMPAVFTVTAPNTVKPNRKFSVTFNTTRDANKLEVIYGGNVYSLEPNNTQAVNSGSADTYRYSISLRAPSSGSFTFTVSAVDSTNDKNKSDPITVTVTVQ